MHATAARFARAPLCAAIVLLGLSLAASSSAGGLASRAGKKAKPQAVDIRRPARPKAVNARMMRLGNVSKLPASRGTLTRGLERYRNARQRIRELRPKLGNRATVKPLFRHKGLVVDRIDVRSPGGAKPKVLIVGGVHAGSERVGVESALQVAELLKKRPDILKRFDVTIVPMVNPTGLAIRERRNSVDVDINRSFAAGKWVPESKAMAQLMKTEKFDAVLDLHGAGKFRNGFFIIRGGDDGGVAKRATASMGSIPLLDAKGAGKTYKLDSPGVVTSSNEGTLKAFAIKTGARYSYTFEAPASLDAKTQVGGMVKLVFSTLDSLPTRQSRRMPAQGR